MIEMAKRLRCQRGHRAKRDTADSSARMWPTIMWAAEPVKAASFSGTGCESGTRSRPRALFTAESPMQVLLHYVAPVSSCPRLTAYRPAFASDMWWWRV